MLLLVFVVFTVLTIVAYRLTSLKMVMFIGLGSGVISLAIHAGSYLLSHEGKAEILMWSSISIPVLSFVLYCIISIIYIVVRKFTQW